MSSSTKSISTSDRARIADLWFDDGNLVIAAGSHLFRVHRSIMSMHSAVFCDMLSCPPSQSQDMYEGVPLLELLDDGEEVKYFLTALYLPEQFPLIPEGCVLPFKAILGALRLSHKYDVPFLRRRALRVFSAEYIMDVNKLAKCPLPRWRSTPGMAWLGITFDQDQWKQVQEELLLAREVGVLCVLPQLLYEASYAPVSMLRSSRLDRAEILACYAGYHATRTMAPSHFECKTSTCTSDRWNTFVDDAKSITKPGFVFDPTSARYSGKMCRACTVLYIEKLGEWRMDFWSRIPEFYGLPCWEDLKEMKAKALEVSRFTTPS
ncbi:hypothetical protein EV122DRAFT_226410 [Schizophyllum commune]